MNGNTCEILPIAKRRRTDEECESTSTSYFQSYDDLQCHQTMISDFPRTHAYRMAILRFGIGISFILLAHKEMG